MIFIGCLKSILGVALLLLVLLLICGMMASRAGGRSASPPRRKEDLDIISLISSFSSLLLKIHWFSWIEFWSYIASASILVDLRQDGFCFKEWERGWRGGRSGSSQGIKRIWSYPLTYYYFFIDFIIVVVVPLFQGSILRWFQGISRLLLLIFVERDLLVSSVSQWVVPASIGHSRWSPGPMPGDMAERISEDRSRDMIASMKEKMPERISEEMPERMSEDWSKDMSENISEDVSDKIIKIYQKKISKKYPKECQKIR